MSTLQTVLVTAVAFAMATLLTGQFRRYALARGLLDIPNDRSSHEQPTPRGGGVAIVLAMLVAVPLFALLGVVSVRVAAALCGGGAIAALIGFLDDRRHVPLLFRLLAQFASAGCVVWFLGVADVARALTAPPLVALVLGPLAVLYLVWMLNLTNFMDGIDGIASTEVISACAGIAVCVGAVAAEAQTTASLELVSLLLLLAAVTLGFLRWNWPPARIFMGDAGSGFLGVVLGAFSIIAAGVLPTLFWSSVILFGAFIVDATVTLFWRIARREKFYHPHRSHAYQHAARRWSHKRVTVTVALINVCWLLPWALLAARGTLHGAVALALAYIPLVATAIRLRAGVPDSD